MSLLLVTAIAALGGFAHAAPASPAAPVLVFLGDSLTAGYGLTPEESYPALVERRIREAGLPHRVVNAGVSGDTSAGGVRRVDWTLRQKPAWVVVALGANDMLRGIDPTETERNLDRILTRVKASGARPILFGMRASVNLGATYRERFDALFARLARNHGAPFLPFFIRPVAMQPKLNLPDGVHPNAEGQRRLAQEVGDFLLPLLRDGKAPLAKTDAPHDPAALPTKDRAPESGR